MNNVLQTAFIQPGPGSFFADHYTSEQVLPTTVIPYEVPLFSTLFWNDNLITERREIEHLKMEAFQQIEENMQQFAILNDHIRNPLQRIIGIADLMENKYSEKIIQLSHLINDIIYKLDRGYLESEKIQEFLRKYYGIGKK
jgi:hypothetical protein